MTVCIYRYIHTTTLYYCYVYFALLPVTIATDWTVRGSNSGGSKIFRTRPDRPWGPPSLLYNGYRVSFLGVKCGRSVALTTSPSSAEVKERVELYLYSSSGPSWPVLEQTLLYFTLLMTLLTIRTTLNILM